MFGIRITVNHGSPGIQIIFSEQSALPRQLLLMTDVTDMLTVPAVQPTRTGASGVMTKNASQPAATAARLSETTLNVISEMSRFVTSLQAARAVH